VAVLAVTAVLVAGCSSSSKGASSSTSAASGGSSASAGGGGSALKGSITVYAAASLTEAFGTLKTDFVKANPGTSITFNFGASSDLSTQIEQGAPVDVFASASTKNMTALGSAALSPTTFVKNTAEIAVPPNNPGKITGVDDLGRSGVKVALCDPAVPCGVLAATVLKNAKVTVKPTAREADVKSTLAVVESGEVDAGVVYVTDVRSAGSKVKGVVVPASVNASTEYPIAPLKAAKNPALAKAFVAYVLSSAGQKVLTADGFAAP
jgi:molybdate transport system substrate-binding protein